MEITPTEDYTTSMVASLRSRTYAIVDTETTGMSPQGGGIIEIGIIRIEEGEVVRTFHSLVRPSRRISHTITGITGITNEELEDAPLFEDIAAEVSSMLEGAVLIAHNARFDYSFLKAEFGRLELPYKAKTLCTVKLSRALYPKQLYHNLDAVMAVHGIACAQRHRAMDDAQVLLEFLRAVERKEGREILSAAIERALKSHTLPAHLSRDDLAHIPNTPGVYMFYSKDDEVLYVGKSVTLRTRVLSHFSSDHVSGKELRMCEETARVEYRETSGELSALFLESKLVKELCPAYNRVLRRHKQLALVVARTNAHGYTEASIEYRDEIVPGEFASVLAVCRTRAQARSFLRTAAKEHELCSKLLGLEKGPGACFGRQIEACRGACIEAETAGSYNRRLAKVFARYRIKSWPFGGAIVVRDESSEGEGTAYVVDQWCLKEVIEYSHGSHSATPTEEVFDLDSYKILARFLLDKKKSRAFVSPYTKLGEEWEAVVE